MGSERQLQTLALLRCATFLGLGSSPANDAHATLASWLVLNDADQRPATVSGASRVLGKWWL